VVRLPAPDVLSDRALRRALFVEEIPMVKDEVLRLAREANLIAANNEASTWTEGTPIYPELHSFAGLVTERVREDWHPHVSEAILALEHAYQQEGEDSVWKRRFKAAASGLKELLHERRETH
jgi:hypothetical protein